MTKKERELYTLVTGCVRSAKSSLEYDMKDYDCSWPEPIIKKLEEAIKYLIEMRPKTK